MRMTRGIPGIVIALVGGCCVADAQTATSPYYKVATPGQRVKMASFSSLDPTCRSLGTTEVSLQSEPHGGQVEVLRGSDFPVFAQANVRFACNRRKVPATLLFYRASTGFTGEDSFDVEAVYPGGTARRYHYTVQVR